MQGMGMALMGTGYARGENRAIESVQEAISSPLLEEASIKGARKAVIHDAAHLPNLEHPAEFNRIVLDFLVEG